MNKLNKAGLMAQRNGVKWWQNPHPGGSVESYEWDKGHTMGRRSLAPWVRAK